MRRREKRKDKIRDLGEDSRLLAGLLHTFRSSSDGQVQQIVALLRSNPPISEIQVAVQQQMAQASGSGRGPSPELSNLEIGLESVMQQPSLLDKTDIARLVDLPPIQVTAAPWTTVTTDDTLVSNLLSVFFTWDGHFYNWLDLDLFLRDMKHGQLDCSFCSPFLVNSLLAIACPYSDYAEATMDNSAGSIMIQFYNEAKRLHEQETDTSAVTNIQGLCHLMAAAGMAGNDAVGYEYMQQVIALYRDMSAD